MDRKEYLPPTDPDDPSYKSAKVAIDMVHDFASRDIVYDLWPIDDPIREAALCTVSAVQLKAGRTVEKALAKLPLEQKRNLVDTIRSVIEISVDKINHAGDHVHQIGGNEIPTLTHTEQLGVIAKEAYQIAHHWDTLQEAGLGQRERIMGAVHGVLNMFQNGTDNVPAMRLLPTDPQTDQGHVVTLYRKDGPVMLDWQYGQPIYPAHPAPSNDAQVFMINSAPGSLTNQFQGIYDTYRDRYRTAAYDLFRDPNDG